MNESHPTFLHHLEKFLLNYIKKKKEKNTTERRNVNDKLAWI